MVSPDGYCPSAEDMLFSIICTTVNWEVAALSYRKQDEDKLEKTKTQMYPQKSEMVCHEGWPHATEPRSDFYLTTGEKNGGEKKRKKEKKKKNNPTKKTSNPQNPKSQEEIQ